jgi:hypothetical protein
LVVEDAGAVVVVCAVFDVVFDGVLAGREEEEEEEEEEEDAGTEGVVGAVWSDAPGVASFFSPVTGTGTSLPAEGFILSE